MLPTPGPSDGQEPVLGHHSSLVRNELIGLVLFFTFNFKLSILIYFSYIINLGCQMLRKGEEQNKIIDLFNHQGVICISYFHHHSSNNIDVDED